MFSQHLIQKLDILFNERGYTNYEGLSVTFEKGAGSSIEDSRKALADASLKAPKDYLDFLEYCDGCILFRFEDLGGFEFLGAKSLGPTTDLQRQTYEEEWDENLVVFCNLICDGDFISFRVNQDDSYDILDCYHDEAPRNWAVISNSLDDFLERLIEAKGKRYWLD